MDGTNEQLKSLELREDLLKREKERLYIVQEENINKAYNLANKSLDINIRNRCRDIGFKEMLILILVIGILLNVAIDKIGYYWTPYNVSVESTNTNNNNNNQNTN